MTEKQMKSGIKHLGGLVLTYALSASSTNTQDRTLSLFIMESGENAHITYFQNGAYDTKALEQINILLQDPRNQTTHKIDPKTLDFLYDVKEQVKPLIGNNAKQEPTIHIISGYRSADTNTDLNQHSQWKQSVAKKSQHSDGTAIDFFIPGVTDEQLRDIAWCMKKGGVGYYPEIADETGYDYIHIDTGRVRFWGGNINFNTIDCTAKPEPDLP